MIVINILHKQCNLNIEGDFMARLVNDVLTEDLSLLAKLQTDLIEMSKSIQALTNEKIQLQAKLDTYLKRDGSPAPANVTGPDKQS